MFLLIVQLRSNLRANFKSDIQVIQVFRYSGNAWVICEFPVRHGSWLYVTGYKRSDYAPDLV